MQKPQPMVQLTILCLLHFLVDFACVALVVNAYNLDLASAFAIFLAYNFIAFALQVPIGLACDKFGNPGLFAIFGLALVFVGALVFPFAYAVGIALAALGNAAFHIGAGVTVLQLPIKKASAIGVFVAPGTFGVYAGTLLGKTFSLPVAVLACALLLGVIILFLLKRSFNTIQPQKVKPGILALPLSFLLFCIAAVAIRALVGSALALPWKSVPLLVLPFAAAVFLGKFLGGLIADRIGYWQTLVISLLGSALLFFGASDPIVGLAAMFLFNMAMPVVLAMLAKGLSHALGLAFGLNCLALFAGSFVALLFPSTFGGALASVLLTLTALAATGIALQYHDSHNLTIRGVA